MLLELVELCGVAAEDRRLDRAAGETESRKAVYVLRDLEPAERLDLPLRRAVPLRIGASEDVVLTQLLGQRSHERRAERGFAVADLAKEVPISA